MGPVRYAASRKFDLFAPLGLAERSYRLWFHISESARADVAGWLGEVGLAPRRFVIVSPGSPRSYKQWHIAGFAALADAIRTRLSLPVVLLWAPSERHDVDRMAAAMAEDPILAPPTDFEQAAALLEQAAVLVCNDGGLNHLAVAVATPSLAIFGKTDPGLWSPAGVFPSHAHVQDPEYAQRGSVTDATFGISTETAFSALTSLLKRVVSEPGVPEQSS
jgi:ADP-heptose:LPS heptosyltransferase